MDNERFQQQMAFILEVDKLKTVFRQSYVLGTDRRENDAEHSWHLALMALVLSEHANEDVDVLRVMKMVLIHDLVEIDAGDTYCYDPQGAIDKSEREEAAAERIFGLLPPVQAEDIKRLWEEFENGEGAEAKFAKALDRLMPLLHNYYSEGKSWKEHGVSVEQVLSRNRQIADGSKTLWDFAHSIINKAVEKGYLSQTD